MDELRVEALRLAKDFLYKRGDSRPKDVVEAAKMFLAFLEAK
jgi:hypothetical protein